jgi:DNA-binding IclR family transcriptional regulator
MGGSQFPDVTAPGEGYDRRSVLRRALALLDAFGAADRTLSVAELVRRADLPKSTVHRMVADLVRYGLLERSGAEVSLGVHLFELGCRVPLQRSLRETGLPFMEDLYETTHQIVHLGVLDGSDVLCIVRINGHTHLGLPSSDGARVPAHATALGKAMLAFSPRAVLSRLVDGGLRALTPYTIVVPEVLLQDLASTCRSGVAFDCEEAVLGMAAVAAPVLDPGRHVLGALGVSGPTSRFDPPRLAQAVRVATVGIARQLAATAGRAGGDGRGRVAAALR